MRWGVVRAPGGRFAPQAWLATNQPRTPVQGLTYVVHRWPLEVTLAEARAHLGVETPRQWKHHAIARTTPAGLALESMVTVLAAHRIGTTLLPGRPAAWDGTASATWSATSALGRRSVWRHGPCAPSEAGADVVNIPPSLVARLTAALCDAA
jgi:hypothetical protein